MADRLDPTDTNSVLAFCTFCGSDQEPLTAATSGDICTDRKACEQRFWDAVEVVTPLDK